MPEMEMINEEERSIELNIKALIDSPTLFDVGYLNIDLLHIMILASLIENGEFEEINKLYFSSNTGRYRCPHRFTIIEYYERYHRDIELKKLSVGSIEIVIASASLVSSVVIPFVLSYLNKKSIEVVFTYDSNDHRVSQLIERLDNSQYLSFDQWFEILVNQLGIMGYNIESNTPNIYSVLKATTNRTSKTLMTVKRIKKY